MQTEISYQENGAVAPYPLCGPKFWANVRKGPDCWEWTGYKNQHGYGRAMTTVARGIAKLMAVHRLSYEHHVGPIPDGKVVMHSCDNRACVNPAHLILGTQSDNLQDMRAKDRQWVNDRAADMDLTVLAVLAEANMRLEWVRPRHIGAQSGPVLKRLSNAGFIARKPLSQQKKITHYAYRISPAGAKLLRMNGLSLHLPKPLL